MIHTVPVTTFDNRQQSYHYGIFACVWLTRRVVMELNLQSAGRGSNHGCCIAECNPGPVFLHMCASVTKQYNLAPAWGWLRAAGEVTVGLAESNGNLPPCLWRCPPADQLQSPTLILIFTLNVVSYVIQSRWFCGMLHLWWSCDRALLCWVRYMNVCTDFVPPCESVCVYIF